jgi:protein-disulfide isomerase
MMFIRLVAAFTVVTAFTILPARTQTETDQIEAIVKNYLAQHPEEVERIVKGYLIKNPEVLRDALTELLKRRRSADAQSDKKAAIHANSEPLFNSPRQVILGNPNGTVTMVEFFDYNCGFCKRALSDMMTLLRDDPNLRIVLKELPILGPGSVEAARVAVAVRMQDQTGEKYLAFHQKLLGGRGHADTSFAMTAARDSGVDMARLEKDMTNDEVRETLDESMKLARVLGITGTPSYVIGDALVAGAIGQAGLRDKIRAARK